MDASSYQKKYLTLLAQKLHKKNIRMTAKMIRRGRDKNREDTESFMKGIIDRLSSAREYKTSCILEMVQAMVSDYLTHDPHAIVLRLKKLLKNIAEHADVEISAHAKDAAEIKARIHELNTSVARKMLVLDDPSFVPGSLLIKANKSIIDAHLHTEIERAREILLT